MNFHWKTIVSVVVVAVIVGVGAYFIGKNAGANQTASLYRLSAHTVATDPCGVSGTGKPCNPGGGLPATMAQPRGTTAVQNITIYFNESSGNCKVADDSGNVIYSGQTQYTTRGNYPYCGIYHAAAANSATIAK